MKKSKSDKRIITIFFIVVILLAFSAILSNQYIIMDEVWSYSFARNVSRGLIPYKDFNVIVTPLSFLINSLFLHISEKMLFYRFVYFGYILIVIFLVNKLLTKIEIKGFMKYLLLLCYSYLFALNCFLEYNFMQDILFLLIVYLSFLNIDFKNKKINIIRPFVVGLTVVNKQSTGLAMIGIYLLFLLISKICFKKDIKISFIVKQALIIMIPSALLLVYLLSFNCLNDFIDIAVLGLRTFNNHYVKLPVLIVSIILIFITIRLFIKNRNDYIACMLFLYSLAALTVLYPLIDEGHLIHAIPIPLLLILYCIRKRIKIIPEYYLLILSLIMILLPIKNIQTYVESTSRLGGSYKGIICEEYVLKKTNKIYNYLKENKFNKKILVLDATSTYYAMQLGKYDKYFDLFMNGNFGVNGRKEIYRIIDEEDNVYLIDDGSKSTQIPTDIIKYVKSKYEVCDKVGDFKAYCKKVDK